MLRMTLFKKTSSSFGKLPIFQKIAIMYSGLFSISLILISLLISTSASIFFSYLNKLEIKSISYSIESYIKQGNVLTSQYLDTVIANQNIGINILEFDLAKSTVTIISPSKFFTYEGFEYEVFYSETKPPKFNASSVNNQKILYYETGIDLNNKKYKVQISKLIHREEKQLNYIYLSFVIANFFGIMISFIIGIYISKKMLEPIKNIRNIARKITIEDLNRRIDLPGPDDDLKDLALSFNDMIDRLDTSFKKQTRFVSDASHELRTPISVIQGYANLIDRWGKDNPAVLQESIDSIKSETQHMTVLIKKLLFLAKNDQDKVCLQKTVFDIKYVCYEIAREVGVTDVAQQFEFTSSDKPAEINIAADYNLIKQMIWIFLENSIKYTDAGKNITLDVSCDNNFAYVSVKDSGCGIPDEDIPFIFDRFYRVDKSRNKDIPGTGLGLSIAMLIAERNNAIINLFSKVNHGTNVIITFPLVKD